MQHLRRPAPWATTLPAELVIVDCRQTEHWLTWRRGKLLPVDHPNHGAEIALAYLRGEAPPTCLDLLEAWRRWRLGRGPAPQHQGLVELGARLQDEAAAAGRFGRPPPPGVRIDCGPLPTCIPDNPTSVLVHSAAVAARWHGIPRYFIAPPAVSVWCGRPDLAARLTRRELVADVTLPKAWPASLDDPTLAAADHSFVLADLPPDQASGRHRVLALRWRPDQGAHPHAALIGQPAPASVWRGSSGRAALWWEGTG